MVFSQVPVYLDPPNWQQQQTNHQHGSSSENPQFPPPPLSNPPGGVTAGSIRPNSMADRARLAKVPQPEVALKCPRCESTNTKFCYFNNYSLSQPRHFCKTCRRYWTRGGALRNVPVGGGCRRNKRSKGSGSKSQGSTPEQQGQSGPGSTGSAPSNSCANDMMCHMSHQPQQLPFMSSLHHLTDYGAADTGLNFGGIHPPVVEPTGGDGRSDMDFHMGSSSGGGGGGNILSSGGPEQWRMQQFPFLAGLDPQQGLYSFNNEGVEQAAYAAGFSQLRSKPSGSMTMHGQTAPVKMEDNQGLNLSRQFLGMPGNDQYLGGNAWTDLSGFTSSSTNHML